MEKVVDDSEIFHYGILRRSGRYPWGSGENPYQRGMSFYAAVDYLVSQGLTEAQIAKSLGFESTSQLRATRSIAKSEIVKAEQLQIERMKAKGMSNVAIANRLGMSEANVRARLKQPLKAQEDIILNTANILKDQIKGGGYLDVGEGTELYLNVSQERLKTALEVLREQGYEVVNLYREQLTNPGNSTTYRVLAPKGTERKDILNNMSDLKTVAAFTEDGGRTFIDVKPPTSVDPSRLSVRYNGEGGETKDGIIELRRGVDDLSLGSANYAQVRIKVGNDHYLKGMAVYSDDLPVGVDMVFNTNKNRTDNKLDALKSLESDPENPFKTTIRQKYYKDSSGKERLSPLNIVGTEDPDGNKFPGEEGYWSTWSRNLSSQMLSKQPRTLVQEQLDISYNTAKAEYDEIMSYTNPVVKRRLLQSFADSMDSSAVKLSAAALPGTATHVLLPINSMKDNEIYAPNYKNGSKVVLIRHPHGGIFEIPQLTVNNKNKEAQRVIGKQPRDAVGINHRVASILSGADFDGDTVLVIPTDGTKIKTSPPLEGLKDFDPNIYQNKTLPKMTNKTLQLQMGDVSNLITDMTIKGATPAEISRAVRHSMVVIDSKKHQLDYKQSAIDNKIPALKEKYQGKTNAGASTLISRASSDLRVPQRKLRPARDGGPIDPKTGELVYVETGKTYVNKAGKEVPNLTETTRMAEARDAHSLVSPQATKVEMIYANHANKLKALANESRKAMIATPKLKYSRSAREVYATEVADLTSKLNIAKKNAPLERHALAVATVAVNQRKAANPDLDKDDIRKIKNQEMAKARARIGAKRTPVDITPKEWEAIQAGAISDSKLSEILSNTDLDVVKQYALPRDSKAISSATMARAKAMANNGYTQADIAAALGISTSSVSDIISG